MSGKLLDNLGQLQRAVIEVVWELGEASVHQVRDRLRRRKELACNVQLGHGLASRRTLGQLQAFF